MNSNILVQKIEFIKGVGPQKASFQQELAPSELEPVSGGPGFSESVSAMRSSL